LKFEGYYYGTHEALAVRLKHEPRHARCLKMPRSVSAGLLYMIMPRDYVKHVITAPWNNTEAVEKIMRMYGNDIAGIILEPVLMNMGVIPYSSILIFGEIKTCSMWCRGVQEYYGVKSDIMVVGKGPGSELRSPR